MRARARKNHEGWLDEEAKVALTKAGEDYETLISKKAVIKALSNDRNKASETDINDVLDEYKINTKSYARLGIGFLISSIFFIILLLSIGFSVDYLFNIINNEDSRAVATYYGACITAGAVLSVAFYQYILREYLEKK